MDTELVLDVAHVHTTVPLVVDEHRKSAAVTGAFLRAGKHEMYVGVTVGDETLHTVESPAILLLVESGLEHHPLKVGACIRLGEVHRHRFTGAYARNVLLALFLASELVESVYAALERPDVLEAGIGCGNHFRKH